ncbi:MAG: M20 family metallopeptidase [Candidatus Binatia bacterium]|jgi:succinyl-diaminopimelate desuccinylase
MTVIDGRASEEVQERLVELTRDLILIPSTCDRPDDIQRCTEFVIKHAEVSEKLTARVICEHDVLSTVILPRGIDVPEVMLFAHLDVVSLPEGTEYRPSVREGRIYGPGAGDMKSELAILLEIFRIFHERYPGISLGLAVTSDEERGGAHGTRFLFETLGLRCRTAIVPDSGSLNDIAVEEKGTLHIKINARGSAGHASRPWLADNPLDRAIATLSKIQNHFATLQNGAGYWYPTCTVTVLQTQNRVPNRIPNTGEVICDIRFPTPFTSNQMLSTVRGFLDEKMDLEVLVAAEPTLMSPDPLFLMVTEEITGKPVRLIREHGGSDARFIAQYGIPVMMSRPFVGNLHADDEWVDIASMEALYRIYERYLERKLVLLTPR